MGRANAICDANALWAARMRYAICEYAMGRAKAIYTRYANKLWAARMRYAIREWDTLFSQQFMWSRANKVKLTR